MPVSLVRTVTVYTSWGELLPLATIEPSSWTVSVAPPAERALVMCSGFQTDLASAGFMVVGPGWPGVLP